MAVYVTDRLYMWKVLFERLCYNGVCSGKAVQRFCYRTRLVCVRGMKHVCKMFVAKTKRFFVSARHWSMLAVEHVERKCLWRKNEV